MAIRALFPTLIFHDPWSGRAGRASTGLCRRMRGAGGLRRGGPALVGAALSRRLHLLRLARPPAPGLVAVRPPAPPHRSACEVLRPQPALRSARPGAGDDRLLGQRHAGRRGAFAAPASDVLHQRHLLCRGAQGSRCAEVRGSAAVAPHGGAARRADAPSASAPSSACRPRRATWSCSKAGCGTRCRRRALPASASRLASTTPGPDSLKTRR